MQPSLGGIYYFTLQQAWVIFIPLRRVLLKTHQAVVSPGNQGHVFQP